MKLRKIDTFAKFKRALARDVGIARTFRLQLNGGCHTTRDITLLDSGRCVLEMCGGTENHASPVQLLMSDGHLATGILLGAVWLECP